MLPSVARMENVRAIHGRVSLNIVMRLYDRPGSNPRAIRQTENRLPYFSRR